MLATLGKYLAVKLLTEKFIKRVCIATAKHLASKTDNDLDDQYIQSTPNKTLYSAKIWLQELYVTRALYG